MLRASCDRFLRRPQVFKKPVFLINFPKEIKSFYMKVNPDGKVGAHLIES